MIRRLSLLLALALAAVLTPAAAAQAHAAKSHDSVVIAAIVYNPSGPDYGHNLRHEVVIIKNTSKHPVHLKGWTIKDKAHHKYTFKHVFLRKGDTVTLHTGFGRDTNRHVYWDRHHAVWNNEGDIAFLRNDKGKLVDVCGYHGTKRGFTLCHR